MENHARILSVIRKNGVRCLSRMKYVSVTRILGVAALVHAYTDTVLGIRIVKGERTLELEGFTPRGKAILKYIRHDRFPEYVGEVVTWHTDVNIVQGRKVTSVAIKEFGFEITMEND